MSEKEKLNMALDDVIKLSRHNTGKRGGGPQGRGGPKGGNRRGGRPQIQGRRGGGRGDGNNRFRRNQNQGNPRFKRRQFARPNKPNFNKEGGQKRIQKRFIKKTGQKKTIARKLSSGGGEAPQQNKKTILRISGLHLNIVNTELYGTAIVQYEKHEHAEKAIADYNGAELDGHKLHVEYMDKSRKEQPLVPSIRRRAGFKPRGNFRGRK